jgi:hypothetical protein
MKRLLYSIATGKLGQLHKLLTYEEIHFTHNGQAFKITKQQLTDALCCRVCKHKLYTPDPRILIKQFIYTRYSFVQQRLTPRRAFKRDLAIFLNKNKILLNETMWKWLLRQYLNDDSAYRKLKLQKIAEI